MVRLGLQNVNRIKTKIMAAHEMLGMMIEKEINIMEMAGLIRTGQVTTRTGTSLMDASTFISRVCAQVPTLTNCQAAVSIDVRSSTSFGDLSNVMPTPINVGPAILNGPRTIDFMPGGASRTTSVIITYDWEFALPLMHAFGNVFGGSARRLQGITIFRNEPF